MKLSVFARGSNPAVDRHIQRKSESYCAGEVQAARADWVDKSDHSKGIVCRELLYFGEKTFAPEPDDSTDGLWRADGELRGVRFIPPPNDPRIAILAAIRAGWDWTLESAVLAG